MKRFFKKRINIYLVTGIFVGVVFSAYVKYADACRLHEVSVNSCSVENWSEKYGLREEKSIVDQPLDSLAEALLNRKDIYRVDISYSLPDDLNIRVNNFSPVGFVLDRTSGRLYGLDRQARLIDLNQSEIEWERPVFTSVKTGRLFSRCADVRIKVVLDHLERLYEKNIDLYRLVDEIDFGNRTFLKVSLAGLDYRLKLRAESFLTDMDRFVEFLTGFEPDLEQVKMLDLCFDDMIIARTGKNKYGR